MIASTDIEYRETKLVKQGKAILEKPFEEFADKIYSKFGIKPLNFYYDILEHNNQPRLQVIFELREESCKFHDKKKILFFDYDKQAIISKMFSDIFANNPKYRTENLYVIFSNFQRVAEQEANSKIPEKMIEELKIRLNNQNIWEIRKSFTSATFFFQTDEQLKDAEYSGMKVTLKDEYFKLLKLFDEFDYIDLSHFDICLDSKENFVNNYQSNWFYYYKDH